MKKVLLIAELSQDYYYKPFIDACVGQKIEIYIFGPSLYPSKLTINIELSMENGISGYVDVIKHNKTGDNIE